MLFKFLLLDPWGKSILPGRLCGGKLCEHDRQFVLQLLDLGHHAGCGVLFWLGPEQGGFADDAVAHELLEAGPGGANFPLEVLKLGAAQLVEVVAEPGHVPWHLLLVAVGRLPLFNVPGGLLGLRHRELQPVVRVYEELIEAAPHHARLAVAAAHR